MFIYRLLSSLSGTSVHVFKCDYNISKSIYICKFWALLKYSPNNPENFLGYLVWTLKIIFWAIFLSTKRQLLFSFTAFLVLFRAQCNCVPLPFLETASLLLVVASSDLVSGRKKSMLDVEDTALHYVCHVLPLWMQPKLVAMWFLFSVYLVFCSLFSLHIKALPLSPGTHASISKYIGWAMGDRASQVTQW